MAEALCYRYHTDVQSNAWAVIHRECSTKVELAGWQRGQARDVRREL